MPEDTVLLLLTQLLSPAAYRRRPYIPTRSDANQKPYTIPLPTVPNLPKHATIVHVLSVWPPKSLVHSGVPAS